MTNANVALRCLLLLFAWCQAANAFAAADASMIDPRVSCEIKT